MNLKELARMDAAFTIEGEQAGNTDCTLSDGGGNEWRVKMLLGDVGFSVDTDGNKIAGRTCWATYIADRVKNGEGVELTPKEGWTLSWVDVSGEEVSGTVMFSEPDRTIGLKRIFIALDL